MVRRHLSQMGRKRLQGSPGVKKRTLETLRIEVQITQIDFGK